MSPIYNVQNPGSQPRVVPLKQHAVAPSVILRAGQPLPWVVPVGCYLCTCLVLSQILVQGLAMMDQRDEINRALLTRWTIAFSVTTMVLVRGDISLEAELQVRSS